MVSAGACRGHHPLGQGGQSLRNPRSLGFGRPVLVLRGFVAMLSLSDLPAAPAHKRGWPWAETSQPLAPTQPDGRPWPRISIVTPSYNQAEFLEETIRSVLLQGYPNLEYIVIDGGSTDISRAIIEAYAPYLAYWV